MVLASAAATTLGCSSTVMLAPLPPENYTVLGETDGRACGVLLLGDWYAAVLPIQLSQRVANARAKAIAKVPGATDLINVTVQENWYYWFIGSSRCVTVTGEAIQS